MRRVAAVLTLAVTLATVAGCGGSSQPGAVKATGAVAAKVKRPTPPARYYLALGDSLSIGVQPRPAGGDTNTSQGYPSLLYASLRRTRPGLRLVQLGCSGETTATMIHGGICSYPGGSQLAAAVSFLRAHRGHVSLITLDIGANDPETCLTASGLGKLSCAARFAPDAAANLKLIVARLHQAAAGTQIVAMNYYLPALAEWRHGLIGEAEAHLIELATVGYNHMLTGIYQKAGIRVADVFDAFHSADFSPSVTVPGFGSLPRNVAAVCTLTWECASKPRGPNQHPNRAGYQVIARAFLAAGASSASHS